MRFTRSVLTVLLLLGLHSFDAATADGDSESPVRAVRMTLAKGALHKVLEQLREVADVNGFKVRMQQRSPNPDDIVVLMLREDIKGIGVDTSDTGANDIEYSIFLYRNRSEATPESAFDDVVAQVRKVLSETEGVSSFIEEEPEQTEE